MILLVALLGAEALSFDLDAKGPPTSDPELVSTFIASYDMHCWQDKCMDAVISCSEQVPACRDHFMCPYSAGECFADVKWSQLTPQEVKVFDCAKKHSCVSAGPASFIEVQLHGKPDAPEAPEAMPAGLAAVIAKMAAANKKAEALRHSSIFQKSDPKSDVPVLEATLKHLDGEMQRSMTDVEDHATFAVKTHDHLDTIGGKLDKLEKIDAPTKADYAELRDLIGQLGQVHDDQNAQFNAFSSEGGSSLLETGDGEQFGPSRLLHMLTKLADLHAPAEAVEALLAHVTGVKRFDPASHLQFDGKTDFHPQQPAGTPAAPEPEPTGTNASSYVPGKNETDATPTAAETPTASPEQLAAEEQAKVNAEVQADEKEYFSGQSTIQSLMHPEADEKKVDDALDSFEAALKLPADAITGNTSGLSDFEVDQQIRERMGLPRSVIGADIPTSLVQVSQKSGFSLAELEHDASTVAERAAAIGAGVEAEAVGGLAAADRALGVDVDANGHLRLHH